jgi:hypothetical protein
MAEIYRYDFNRLNRSLATQALNNGPVAHPADTGGERVGDRSCHHHQTRRE